ncbi:MAG: Jag N-terminal domain-containing protein [Actinobacteria bacterium]|nr:Jag N-terminal domain-containing protein [Actinomycetota bacterium]MCB9390043.1 Jag N-terminal domain-containing protein [Acidimicrobiia bacterium]
MEWIETVGRTEAEAKGLALDRLGIAEGDLEYEVIEESKRGLLRRAEVRIRARVRPVTHEPQRTRRRRQRGSNPSEESRGDRSGRSGRQGSRSERSPRRQSSSQQSADQGKDRSRRRAGNDAPVMSTGTDSQSPSTHQQSSEPANDAGQTIDTKPRQSDGGNRGRGRSSGSEAKAQKAPMETSEQATMIEDFLDDLLDAFDMEANVSSVVDDDVLSVTLSGDDLGLLIGPDAVTNRAIQEICRTILHRKGGSDPLRVNVDVAGYRDARRTALIAFTERTAAAVRETGLPHRMDWMNSSDRKVVHDVVNDIDGVATISEGQEPRRNVVLVADGPDASADDDGDSNDEEE